MRNTEEETKSKREGRRGLIGSPRVQTGLPTEALICFPGKHYRVMQNHRKHGSYVGEGGFKLFILHTHYGHVQVNVHM